MAKKNKKSHHDKGVTQHINRDENQNTLHMQRDSHMHQQAKAEQNLVQNEADGNKDYDK